jgi:hypothetical protein
LRATHGHRIALVYGVSADYRCAPPQISPANRRTDVPVPPGAEGRRSPSRLNSLRPCRALRFVGVYPYSQGTTLGFDLSAFQAFRNSFRAAPVCGVRCLAGASSDTPPAASLGSSTPKRCGPPKRSEVWRGHPKCDPEFIRDLADCCRLEADTGGWPSGSIGDSLLGIQSPLIPLNKGD